MSSHRILADLAGAPYEIVDPGQGGTIVMDRSFLYCPLVSTETETSASLRRVLATPTSAGLTAMLSLKTDGGDVAVYTESGFDQATTTTITFDTAGDWTLLQSIAVGSAYRWRVIAGEGASIPTYASAAGDFDALTATAATIPSLHVTDATALGTVGAATAYATALTATAATIPTLTATNVVIGTAASAASILATNVSVGTGLTAAAASIPSLTATNAVVGTAASIASVLATNVSVGTGLTALAASIPSLNVTDATALGTVGAATAYATALTATAATIPTLNVTDATALGTVGAATAYATALTATAATIPTLNVTDATALGTVGAATAYATALTATAATIPTLSAGSVNVSSAASVASILATNVSVGTGLTALGIRAGTDGINCTAGPLVLASTAYVSGGTAAEDTQAVALSSPVCLVSVGTATNNYFKLPVAAVGLQCNVINLGSTAGLVGHTAGVSIASATSVALATANAVGSGLDLVCDGTNWWKKSI